MRDSSWLPLHGDMFSWATPYGLSHCNGFKRIGLTVLVEAIASKQMFIIGSQTAKSRYCRFLGPWF